MKRILLILTVAVMTTSCGVLSKVDTSRALYGVTKALQAATITDEQVQSYMRQYVAQLDASNKMCAANSTYSRRLATLTKGLTDVDGLPLNFKVYQTDQVNAFACADGSVRVYSGLMDLLTDDEVLGVIGHEIGHVALKHSKKEVQNAYLTVNVRTPSSVLVGSFVTLPLSHLWPVALIITAFLSLICTEPVPSWNQRSQPEQV